MQVQRDLQNRNPGELRCKCVLLLIFLLGAALIWAGVWGMGELTTSGFEQEGAYGIIYQLSPHLDKVYEKNILPYMNKLDASTREAVNTKARELLILNWSEQAKSDQTALVDSILSAEKDPEAAQMKLLAVSYSMAGPKVSSKEKKVLAAFSDAEREAFRMQLLTAIVDDQAELPEVMISATEKDEGMDKTAKILQFFLTAANAEGDYLPKEIINNLKKAARSANARLTAYQMAEKGEINFFSQLLLSNTKTAVLVGIAILLDVLLLFFLLKADGSWQLNFKWLIILAIIDFMLLFQVMPMIYLVITAFFPEGKFTFEVFARLYTYPMNQGALVNTLVAAGATMVLGTLLAFPLAWLVGRTNMYGRKFFRSLFVLTYMVPPYLGAMAWLRLLNPNVGTINVFLRGLFGMGDTPGPLNIYSLGGLIWVLTTFYYPYAFITISRAMEKMDPSLEEASRISGASPIKTVFKITLPMATPSLIAGALLVFISAASCYGIPSIIGAPGKVHTVTTRIIEYMGLGARGISDATGLAVFLMVIAMVILFISDFVVAKKQYITVSGKSTRPNIVDLGVWRIPVTALVVLFAGVVIILPFVTIFTTSFKLDVGKSMFDPTNFTTENWTTIFSRTETIACLKNSLVFGIVTATVGIVIACTMSYLLQRTRIKGRKIPDFLIALGSGTPSVVIALGLIMTMKGNFGINIYNTAYIIIVAYLVKYLMMGMRTVVSAMSQIHVSLEECSQISGASWGKTMLKITGPLIFPSIAAGWFLIFIPSFYELSMTTLLYSNSTKTIGFQLYEYWTFTNQPQACAMAFGILIIVIVLNFVLNRLTKGEFSI